MHNELKSTIVMLPCRRRRRWRPCAARVLCPLKPWWAVLGLLCPSMIHTGCPGTSVSDVPLLSSRLSFPSPPNFPDSVFLIHVPGKQAAVDVYVSVIYDVPLPLEILLKVQARLSLAGGQVLSQIGGYFVGGVKMVKQQDTVFPPWDLIDISESK